MPSLTSAELQATAEQYGLRQMGVRPPLATYVRQVASRWAFIQVLARSKAYAKNQNTYLGQLWSLLTPVLNALVYVIIFGYVIQSTRGLKNAIAFIIVGTFTYRFFEQSVTSGSRAVAGNMRLVRSLHFPRAILPISSVLSNLTTLVPALVAMLVMAWASGLLPDMHPVPITWRWLLLPFAIVLFWIFNTGCAFFVARWVAITPDLDNVIGFVLRFVMYGSGVMFPISHYTSNAVITSVLEYQPVAVYLYLVRSLILDEKSIPPEPVMWVWAVVWAVVFFAAGFVMFWRGEERYGRD